MSLWWDNDEHKRNSFMTWGCTCPYHQKLRDDAEDDRREQAETEADDDK